MTDTFHIRRARADEAEALHALSIRSKAHWGYDAAFMAQARPKLALPEAWFAADRVLTAEIEGKAAGVAAVMAPDAQGLAELEHLFVDPVWMGRGVGAALLGEVVTLARAEGARGVLALSDPQARPFYERHGFRWLRDAPSDAIPGRTLPLLLLALPAGGVPFRAAPGLASSRKPAA